MKTMIRFSSAVVLAAVLVAAAAPAALCGKKDKVAVTVHESFHDRTLERIGILTIITPTVQVQDDRIEMMADMASGAIQDQGEFYLLFVNDLKAAAERAGEKEAYDTMIRVWNARRLLDPPSLKKIQAATSVDALIAVEVTHFEQKKLEAGQEGYATTTVGLKIQMFDARDLTPLWEASEIKVSKSPPYIPSAQVTQDASGGARQTAKGLPEPPQYDVVAQEVVDSVIGTFPKEKDKGKKKKAKKDDEESK